jgi:hypothetical protein
MKRRTNAPIVHIRRIHNATHAAIYVAKYIAKAPERFEGCKRYWASHHYAPKMAKPERPEGVTYRIVFNARKFLENWGAEQIEAFEQEGATAPFKPALEGRRSSAVHA